MLRIVIVDDEQGGRNVLAGMVGRFCPNAVVVASADSVESGLSAIREHRPDLVFLDVEMPPSTGFDLLERIGRPEFHVVFVTAHDHYAIRAIRFSALDYLLKPVDPGELRSAVEKAVAANAEGAGTEQLDVLFQGLRNNQAKIALPTREGLVFARVADILRCEAESNYTKLFLEGGAKHIVSKTLKEFEHLLGEFGFVRVHQSHLVNASHITKYIRGEGGTVVLADGSRVDVSRRHKPALMERLKRL